MKTYKIRNRVLSSPWTSRAPYGLGPVSGNLTVLPYSFGNSSHAATPNVKPRVQQHRNLLKESAFFRNLNKNALVLSFPEVHPNQIDAALTLCDNDLSESISLLRLRVRVLRSRKLQMEKKNASKITQYVPIQRKAVNYIPTKYHDVHIVEVNNNNQIKVVNNINNNQIKVMEVNQNVLQMLETCNTTMLVSQNNVSDNNIRSMTTHTITSSTNTSCLYSPPEFSPATSTTSSVWSGDSNKLQVYDFTEDQLVQYHLPKPSRKPINKVGIILKKDKFGLSVRLL